MTHSHRVLALAAALACSAAVFANDPPSQSAANTPIRSNQSGTPRTGNEDPASKAQAEMVSNVLSDDDSMSNFEHIDADDSGSISREEFDVMKHQSMTFTDVDTDRNSVISHQEWDNHGLNTDDDK